MKAAGGGVRRSLQEIDPALAIMDIVSMEHRIELSLLPQRLAAVVVAGFDALLLGASRLL